MGWDLAETKYLKNHDDDYDSKYPQKFAFGDPAKSDVTAKKQAGRTETKRRVQS